MKRIHVLILLALADQVDGRIASWGLRLERGCTINPQTGEPCESEYPGYAWLSHQWPDALADTIAAAVLLRCPTAVIGRGEAYGTPGERPEMGPDDTPEGADLLDPRESMARLYRRRPGAVGKPSKGPKA